MTFKLTNENPAGQILTMGLSAGINGKARENTKVQQHKGYITLCQILIVRCLITLLASVAIRHYAHFYKDLSKQLII